MEVEQASLQELADASRQKVEYTLRGHASFLPGSLSYTTDSSGSSSNGREEVDVSVEERMRGMVELLERAEKESRVVCELRAKLKSQSVSPAEKEDLVWRQAKLMESFGIQPGLSIDMYDMVLDAIAVSNLPEGPALAHSLLQRAVKESPTPLTFNAVLRTIANATATDTSTKELLDYATQTFVQIPQPNAASYTYMMQIFTNTLPESKSRANIMHALYRQAGVDGVVSNALFKTFEAAIQSDPDYQAWFQTLDIPQSYRRNVRKYSYQNDANSTY